MNDKLKVDFEIISFDNGNNGGISVYYDDPGSGCASCCSCCCTWFDGGCTN